jgi:plastocyanin
VKSADRIPPPTVDSSLAFAGAPDAAPDDHKSNLLPEVTLKMRRPTIIIALLVSLVAIAACTASAPPGWTYAPASATPIASASASGSPGASSSATPSGSPSPAPSSAPSASAAASASAGASGGTGSTLAVTAPVGASTSGFDPTTLDAVAKAPFTLVFDNQDTGVMHNLVIKNPDGSKVQVTGDSTTFFAGPGKRTYQVPGLAAGDYAFMCEVHPGTMKGILTVK